MTFGKFDLRIECPPPYERLLWNNKQADTLLPHSINDFNWEYAFSSISIDQKVEMFNKIILNIFGYYYSSKTIIFNDKDPPLWLMDRIITLI